MKFLDLPDVMLEEVFEYLSYDEISKKRLICRKIDQICQQVLNRGFNKVVKRHSVSFKRIKLLLPRRESERRIHYLARHADILNSIETRISMLSMTYSKYIEGHLCCFIPGRVLDEILDILKMVETTRKPLRPHEVLQELRDISSMAIEHFDEKIAVTLKANTEHEGRQQGSGNSTSSESGLRTLSFGCGSINISSSVGVVGPWKAAPSASSSTTYSYSSGSGTSNWSSDNIQQHVNVMLGMEQTDSSCIDISHVCSGHGQNGCPKARTALEHVKKVEAEYKKGCIKLHKMQQAQSKQARRLQEVCGTLARTNALLSDFKKRLDDLEAKEREICANVKQINPGDPIATVIPPSLSLPNNPKVMSTDSPGQSEANRVSKKRRHDEMSSSVILTDDNGQNCTSTATTITETGKKPKV